MIVIYTLSTGRWHYLSRLIDSIWHTNLWQKFREEHIHYVLCQGKRLPRMLEADMRAYTKEGYNVIPRCLDKNIGIGPGLRKLSGSAFTQDDDLVVKLDEDVVVRGRHFFEHAAAIHTMHPRLCFHAAPIGVQTFANALFGEGVHVFRMPAFENKSRWIVTYNAESDTFFALVRVPFLGGMARIAPGWVWKSVEWTEDPKDVTTDRQFSSFCAMRNLVMAYNANAIVAEHQESIAQRLRYTQRFGTENSELLGGVEFWKLPGEGDAVGM
jgi:hypothetical protein